MQYCPHEQQGRNDELFPQSEGERMSDDITDRLNSVI